MRHLFILLIGIAFCGSLFAQVQRPDQIDENWTLYKSTNGINVYYKSENCSVASESINSTQIIFRFENTTNSNLIMEWANETWYNDKCTTCELAPGERIKKIKLAAGQVKEGDCHNKLKLYYRSLDGSQQLLLTGFEMKDITVNQY